MDNRNLEAFLGYYKAEQAHLARVIRTYNRGLRKEPNPLIRPLREDLADLNEGGKLLRGVLVKLGYHLAEEGDGAGGGADDAGDGLALAFEIFQTGVLIHDDIIDHADLRRGKLTVHRRCELRMNAQKTHMVTTADTVSSVARSAAICVGDMGLYEANRVIADRYRRHPALGDLITYFDDTVIETIRGELLDVMLPYVLQDPSYSEEEKRNLLKKSVHDIYHMKTARYSVIGPLHLGMMLGGAPEARMRSMDRFADDLGVAYQIMDDILAIYSDARILGKDVGSDISEFKQTILYMYVRTTDEKATEELLRHYGGHTVTDEDLEAVRRIFEESGALAYARDTMNACFTRAERKLSRMKFLSSEDKEVLRGFIEWCKGRRK